MSDFLAAILLAIWGALEFAGFVDSTRPDRFDDSKEISPADRIRRLREIDSSKDRPVEELPVRRAHVPKGHRDGEETDWDPYVRGQGATAGGRNGARGRV